MCKKKESQGPKSYLNTHALRQAITPTDTYAYKHRCTFWLTMHACILSPSTYMYTQLTYVQSLAPLYMLSDTHQCTYIHSCVYTLTQLGNTSTRPQAHALYRSFLLQQVVPPGWESGPPGPEVNEVPNQLGIVCVSVVLSVVTQSGHQGAPRIHPAFTFRCFCQRVDCFCTPQGAPSCPETLCGTVRLFALSPAI